MRRLGIGDVHGNYKGLLQALQRADFDPTVDQLVSLGDLVDGLPDVYECVQFFIDLDKLNPGRHIFIRGNHDQWFNQFLQADNHPADWSQGGYSTLESYCKRTNKNIGQKFSGYVTDMISEDIDPDHLAFFKNQKDYHLCEDGTLYVHGGFNRHYSLEDNARSGYIFYWDRDLWSSALSFSSMSKFLTEIAALKFKLPKGVKRVFIGHTTTLMWDKTEPMKAGPIWNLDTGAGHSGRLTIMDLDTEQFWQSDTVAELYPDYKGRK